MIFLPADKRKSFLQVDRITLRVPSQTCPKYPNSMFVISLQYHKENIKDEVNLLPVHKQEVFSNLYYHFRNVPPGMPKLPKASVFGQACLGITQNNMFAIFSEYIKKEVNDEVDFLHADKYESFLQIDTLIVYDDGQEKIGILQCFYNISKKKLEMNLIFCMQISIKFSCKLISTLGYLCYS